MFNFEIEICSNEILNSKSKKNITDVYRPPKADIKVLENYCKDFLSRERQKAKQL